MISSKSIVASFVNTVLLVLLLKYGVNTYFLGVLDNVYLLISAFVVIVVGLLVYLAYKKFRLLEIIELVSDFARTFVGIIVGGLVMKGNYENPFIKTLVMVLFFGSYFVIGAIVSTYFYNKKSKSVVNQEIG